MAELGDVSEGECSSVEDLNDAETCRRRMEEEELYRLNQVRNPQVEAMNIDSSGGVVAVAQQVSKKELEAPPKCARFSLPDDDTESLIDPQESMSASVAGEGEGGMVSDVAGMEPPLAISPHHHQQLHQHSILSSLAHARAESNASNSINSTAASCGTETDNIAQLDADAASPPFVTTAIRDGAATSPEFTPTQIDQNVPAAGMSKQIKWTTTEPHTPAAAATAAMHSNSDSSQMAPGMPGDAGMKPPFPGLRLGPGTALPFPQSPGSAGMASSAGDGSSLKKDSGLHHENRSGSVSGCDQHRPTSLPTFNEPRSCMWTSSHAANSPSEDRSSSLVNVLLQPLPPNFDSETQLPALETSEFPALVRLNLWSVIDGHGGGCVATYASEVLLPHIAASISRALGCDIVSRGTCLVNGQLRDANALDLDGLIKTSDHRSQANPNSIHYRSPYEASGSEDEGDGNHDDESAHHRRNDDDSSQQGWDRPPTPMGRPASNVSSSVDRPPPITSSLLQRRSKQARKQAENLSLAPSGSSVKTSVKTTTSVVNLDAPVGTHSPNEVAAITRAITESFLAVDEGWINSIDPVATHQTSCQSNGRWNSGACALVVFTIQRLEWTSVSEEHRERELRGPAKGRGHEGSQNKDAARRRMLDYATRAKSASSFSTISSSSSLTTAEDRINASGMESEITETEGEGEGHSSDEEGGDKRGRRNTLRHNDRASKESLISPPGGCSCHCYRAYDALLYTAHVGDCRAVMLGSAPPRTIKVHGTTGPTAGTTTDDESSHHSSDETECLSSSDHDADSSDDEDVELNRNKTSSKPAAGAAATNSYMTYMRPRRQSRRRRYDDVGMNAPFIALPALEGFRSVEIELDSEYENKKHRRHAHRPAASGQSASSKSSSSTSSQDSREFPPAIVLPAVTRPIDLTTDHSAYNPAEVTAVLRRCNNAPRAISAGVGGGIKRVAGSLAVTRALGDAYLKTPLLSFFPYKRHAPYITARPEVNCRPLVKEGDKVLLLATDGVWERASGEDVLRWVRTFYTERMAEAERRNKLGTLHKSALEQQQEHLRQSSDEGSSVGDSGFGNGNETADSEERTQHQKVSAASKAAQSLEGPQPQLEEMAESNEDGIDVGTKRDASSGANFPPPVAKRRKLATGIPAVTTRRVTPFGSRRNSTVADVIVRRVLNKVRRTRNISSLHALMSLPPGRARRSKHDDITACVVDLTAFVS